MTGSTQGKILTAGFIAIGVGIAIKNYKKEGFWYGVAALFVAGITIKVSGAPAPKTQIG